MGQMEEMVQMEKTCWQPHRSGFNTEWPSNTFDSCVRMAKTLYSHPTIPTNFAEACSASIATKFSSHSIIRNTLRVFVESLRMHVREVFRKRYSQERWVSFESFGRHANKDCVVLTLGKAFRWIEHVHVHISYIV